MRVPGPTQARVVAVRSDSGRSGMSPRVSLKALRSLSALAVSNVLAVQVGQVAAVDAPVRVGVRGAGNISRICCAFGTGRLLRNASPGVVRAKRGHDGTEHAFHGGVVVRVRLRRVHAKPRRGQTPVL